MSPCEARIEQLHRFGLQIAAIEYCPVVCTYGVECTGYFKRFRTTAKTILTALDEMLEIVKNDDTIELYREFIVAVSDLTDAITKVHTS